MLLDGVLFDAPGGSDTVVIAITGIHGNFYSNPFYMNFGERAVLLGGVPRLDDMLAAVERVTQ